MGIQKLNKKGSLKSALFSVVVLSMFILAIGIVVGEWGVQYNSGIDYDLNEYQALDEFSDEAQKERESITPQDPDPGTGDFEGQLFRGGYGTIGRIFTPFRIVFNMFSSLERRFGIPNYVGQGILTMIFFSLITLIIMILFRLTKQA